MRHRYHLLLLAAVLGFAPALLAGQASATQDSDQLIHAKATDDHDCDADEWHWVITQVDSEALAPATISASFSDGIWVLSLDAFTGKTAHYRLAVDADYAPQGDYVGAATMIYSDWDGQFNLSHGPCDPPQTTTRPTTTTAPTTTLPVTTTAPTTSVTTTQPTTTVAPTTSVSPTTAPTTTDPGVSPKLVTTAPTALAVTGSNSLALAGLANALVCAGLWVTFASRRRGMVR